MHFLGFMVIEIIFLKVAENKKLETKLDYKPV